MVFKLWLLARVFTAFAHDADPCVVHLLQKGEDAEVAYEQILKERLALGERRAPTVRMVDERGRTVRVWQNDIPYIMTDRSLEELQKLFLHGEIDPRNLTGLKVLEAGTGQKAILSNYLAAQGVDILGIDLALTPENQGQPHLRIADMTEVEFPPQRFDVILTSHTLFLDMYEGRNWMRVALQLERFRSWLKPGGRIHIAGIELDILHKVLFHFKGLELAREPYGTDVHIVTLRRTN